MAGEVLLRGRADLGQPRAGHRVAEPGDRFQQACLPLVRGGLGSDLFLQAGDRRVEQRDPVQVQPAQHRMMISEPAGESLGQVRQLARGPHPAYRQVRQHLPAPLPIDQRFDHQPRRLASQVGDHRVELDPRRFQRLGQPLDLRGTGLHRLDPVPGQVPQILQRLGRDVTAAQQPAPGQLRQPQRVFRVRLVPLQGLGVRRVDHRDLLEVAFHQRVIHRLGIHTAGLHHHMGDTPLAQVRGHRLEHTVKGPVLQHLRGARPRPVTRRPDPDLDHVLVDVDPRDPLIHHSHSPPASCNGSLRNNREKAGRLPEPKISTGD